MNASNCITGRDGWMFLGNAFQLEFDQAVGAVDLPDGFIDGWIGTLERMELCCRRRGVIFLPVIVPSKPSVYLDKVALEGADKRPWRSPMSQILAAARAAGLDLIDLRPPLTAARSQAATFSRLNSHWTDFGAWVAWGVMADVLRRRDDRLAGLTDVAIEAVVEIDNYNEMHLLCGHESVNNWTRPRTAEPLPNVVFVNPDGTHSWQAGDRQVGFRDLPVDVRNAQAATDGVCLVLGDSTVSAPSPWLNRNFRQVSYRNHHAGGLVAGPDLADTLAATEATVAIYLMTERYCILPLPDADRWEALDLFETADPATGSAWPPQPAFAPLACIGGSALGVPNLVRLPAQAPGGRLAARFAVTSEGEGVVLTAFTLAGVDHQTWHTVQAGVNHLYLVLPSRTDGDHLWLLRDADRAPVMLTSAVVRPLP